MRLITLYVDDHHVVNMDQLKRLALENWPIVAIHDTDNPRRHLVTSNHVLEGCEFCSASRRELPPTKGSNNVSERNAESRSP